MNTKRTEEADAPAREAMVQGAGRKPSAKHCGAEVHTATSGQTKSEDCRLLERVVGRSNMRLVYQRVVENEGAAGVDNLAVSELKDWLVVHWPSVKQALLEGRYSDRWTDSRPGGAPRSCRSPS